MNKNMNDQSHLSDMLKATPVIPVDTPMDCHLWRDPKRPRLTAEQCALTINCLVRDDGPRNLKLAKTSGLKGEPGYEWVEASAEWDGGLYRWGLFVRGGMITNCFLCTTPKGSEYWINSDGGSPADHITIEDRKALTHMLVNSQMKNTGIEVVPAYIICINGARPYCGGNLYYDKSDAEAAAVEQREHYAKYNGLHQKHQDDEQREIAKDRATIAHKPKKTSKAPRK